MKGIQSIGKGVAALVDFCATLNLSHRALLHKAYRGHTDTMVEIGQAAATATETASIEVVRALYKNFLYPVVNVDIILMAHGRHVDTTQTLEGGASLNYTRAWCWIASYCLGSAVAAMGHVTQVMTAMVTGLSTTRA